MRGELIHVGATCLKAIYLYTFFFITWPPGSPNFQGEKYIFFLDFKEKCFLKKKLKIKPQDPSPNKPYT